MAVATLKTQITERRIDLRIPACLSHQRCFGTHEYSRQSIVHSRYGRKLIQRITLSNRTRRFWRFFAAAAAALLLAIPAWGYWRAVTLAVIQVHVYDVSLKNDRQAYGSAVAADLTFRDAAGGVLATGRAEKPYGVVRIVHPTVGDCTKEERQGGKDWDDCFELTSRWQMTWAQSAHHATVRLDNCTIDRVPVVLEKSRDSWWLWWVPAPHLDNSAFTFFTFTLWIDGASCRIAGP